MELQQSPLYKKYIESLGWSVATLDTVNIFYRKLPFIGVFVKIQRPKTLPYLPTLIPFLQRIHAHTIAVDATSDTDQKEFSHWMQGLQTFFRHIKDPFLPTKTILIDLTPSEEIIFKRWTEAKRRAVRRAEKNNIIVRQSHDIEDLIRIKNKSAGMLGSMTTHGVKNMWHVFGSEYMAILIAQKKGEKDPLGGVLLVFWENTAYYWVAGATKKGKKFFVPTLLIWEAVKLAKKHGATQFDFVGVWDERMPRQNTEWKGFTKFKEGFGGEELYYPIRNS